MAASMNDVVAAINAAAGPNYSCKPVSWEDCTRGKVNDALSCWGPNISDVRLWEKEEMLDSTVLLYTVRSSNWNEKLSLVNPKNVAVVVGNQEPYRDNTINLKSITLDEYLRNLDRGVAYGAYAGIKKASDQSFISSPLVDNAVTIRFQTVFLPIKNRNESIDFCTEVYNYQARDDSNARNLLILATPQGTSVQQDGRGAKKIFYHQVDASGKIHRYWLEAEASTHKVGGNQLETEEERNDALSRGKSTAMHIGIAAMVKRFNVQMLIQIPIKQKLPETQPFPLFEMGGGPTYFPKIWPKGVFCSFGKEGSAASPNVCFGSQPRSFNNERCAPKGISNAARVSQGSEMDIWDGLRVKDVERDAKQVITITVTMYYTVTGGVPRAEDVKSAIADLEMLYKSTECTPFNLKDAPAKVTKELTVGNMVDIQEKIQEQPYKKPKFTVCVDNPFVESPKNAAREDDDWEF